MLAFRIILAILGLGALLALYSVVLYVNETDSREFVSAVIRFLVSAGLFLLLWKGSDKVRPFGGMLFMIGVLMGLFGLVSVPNVWVKFLMGTMAVLSAWCMYQFWYSPAFRDHLATVRQNRRKRDPAGQS